MRIVFLGTSSFACPTLEALADEAEIAWVITQPDRPAGRGRKLCAPPVKRVAERLGLPILQPAKASAPDVVDRVASVHPDAAVVAAFGQLLKRPLFSLPPLGTINLHGSLLPKYRGAAPIHWALIHGEAETGVTTFLLDEGMDTGDMLLQAAVAVGEDETAGELEDRLAPLGAELMLRTLHGLETGRLTPTPQPDEGSSLAPKLTRADGEVRWDRPAREIHNQIRGMNPWPGAFANLGEERLKIHRSALTGIGRGELPIGEFALPETGRFLVATADELLELIEVQRACRAATSGAECLRGIRDQECFT
jgi:methionyl-tRNA formyltransferase